MMNQKIKAPVADPSKINTRDKKEMDYWLEKFDVTRVRLTAAINAVGPVVKDVTAYLKK